MFLIVLKKGILSSLYWILEGESVAFKFVTYKNVVEREVPTERSQCPIQKELKIIDNCVLK